MRRIVLPALLALLAPLLLVLGQAPASAVAGTVCNVVGPHDHGIYSRQCEIDSSRIAGVIKGTAYWHYKTPPPARGDWGGTTLQVKDRSGDRLCTVLKITYRGSDPWETQVRKACHGRTLKPEEFDLNLSGNGAYGIHPDGYYTISSCVNTRHHDCYVLWRQKVGQRPPR